MKIRNRARCCALLIGLASGSSVEAAPTEDKTPTALQTSAGVTCNRASETQLTEIQAFFDFIKTRLGNISDPQAVAAGRAAAASIELALPSGCLDPIAKSFTDLRNRQLGSNDAAYDIWKAASQVSADIVQYQSAPDQVETIDIAIAQDIISRWQRPSAEAAEFYFHAAVAYRRAAYANKDPKAFDRALAIARERVLPLAGRDAYPELWFRIHLMIGDLLLGKTTMLEQGETLENLAKQSIAATELALLVTPVAEERLYAAHFNLASAYAVASSSTGFSDQSLNEGTVAAARKVLSDPRLTPDMPQWGYVHDAYARATIIPAQQMQNPERSRRIKDAMAVVEQGLAKIDRDRNLLVWARLQTDRGIAALDLGADQPDEAYALRNLDLAIASFEAILAVKDQITASGGQDIVAGTQANLRETLSKKAIFASPKARPAQRKR